MAHRGKPSTAHEYSKTGECIHCGMYRSAVEMMAHVCTAQRERQQDEKDAVAAAQDALIQAEANDHGE